MEFTIGGPLFKRLQWLNHKKPGYVVNDAILEVFQVATRNTQIIKEVKAENPELAFITVSTGDFKKLSDIIAKKQKAPYDRFVQNLGTVRTLSFTPVWGTDGLSWVEENRIPLA